MSSQPAFLYATLALPFLFALVLVIEGISKLVKHESGWISVTIGMILMGIVVGVYFGILYR
jgi:hypothetical protein